MLPMANVGIPSGIAIPCPKKSFNAAMADDACPKCEYFDGIGCMSDDPNRPWHERFAIRCVHPIERRTQPVQFPAKDIMGKDIKKLG